MFFFFEARPKGTWRSSAILDQLKVQIDHTAKYASFALFRHPNRLKKKSFQICFRLDLQINNGIFNRPIMVHSQILGA